MWDGFLTFWAGWSLGFLVRFNWGRPGLSWVGLGFGLGWDINKFGFLGGGFGMGWRWVRGCKCRVQNFPVRVVGEHVDQSCLLADHHITHNDGMVNVVHSSCSWET